MVVAVVGEEMGMAMGVTVEGAVEIRLHILEYNQSRDRVM